MLPYPSAQFLKSCPTAKDLPAETGPEVAFSGRSNSGKSSTLNKLCQQRGLAKVSKTPGRTQMINFFELSNGARLADLPGYGFAKVPEREKRRWQQLIDSYLTHRQTLAGLVIVMDARRPLLDHDWKMLQWCRETGLPAHIVLNKSDKLKRGILTKTLNKAQQEANDYLSDVSVQTLSAMKGTGLQQLQQKLDAWLTEPLIDDAQEDLTEQKEKTPTQ